MQMHTALVAIVIATIISFYFGRRRALAVADSSGQTLHSLASYYGYASAIWCMLAASLGLAALQYWGNNFQMVKNSGLVVSSIFIPTAIVLFISVVLFKPRFRARNHVEKWINATLWLAACASIAVTIMVVLSIVFESYRFFKLVNISQFLFGTHWSPQQATGSAESLGEGFGIIPVFIGTILITTVAMLVAVPCGLFSAIQLSEYTSPRVRTWIKPVLEILAGIPTVVYGFFAATVVAPKLRDLGDIIGLPIATESAMTAGLVMGVMVIPFVMSLSDDIIHAVPRSLREGSLALGATTSETIRKVVIPAALPGIMGACLLAVSRAIGETMIVFMAAGLVANFTFNPLQPVTTVTAQIVMLLVGDQEFNSPQTLAAFALGLSLFVVTLLLNVIALIIVKKYREKYE